MSHFLSLMGFGLLYTCKKQTISVHECAELTNLERDKNITHRLTYCCFYDLILIINNYCKIIIF